jgi:hypothetical protein
MMRTLLFDDSGEIWDANSRSLAEALQASLSSDELAKYVVRNLGFISAAESVGSVRLRLRPAIVSPTALSALFYWLHDQTIERVLISFLDGEWTHELVRTCEEAVRALLARVKFSAADREGDFLHLSKPLHDLPDTSPLHAVLTAWSESGGKFNRERLFPILDKALNGRFVLFENVGNSPHVHVKDVGAGLGKSAAFWLSRTKGLRVEDQPDYAYGKWVAEAYRQVLSKREPSLEDVDAVITWPQQPRISYRYRRLLVPFEERNSTLILSATVIDPDVNLRRKPG